MIKNSRTTSKINIVSSSSRRENYNISRLTAFGLLHAFTTSTVCFFLPHTKRILSGKWTSRKRNNFLWNFNFHQSSSSTYGGQEAATTAVTAQHTDRKRNTIGNDTHSVRVALFRHFHYDGFIKLLSKQSAKEEKKKKRPKTIWRNNRISAIVFTHNPPESDTRTHIRARSDEAPSENKTIFRLLRTERWGSEAACDAKMSQA